MRIKREDILEYFSECGDAPVHFRDLMLAFGVTKAKRPMFKEFLDAMVDAGLLVKLKGTVFSLPRQTGLIRGRVSKHPDGFGFVSPADGGEDLFIPARYMRDSLHGDLVEARVAGIKKYGKREGRIVRTVERGIVRVVGRFEATGNNGYVIPDEKRLTQYVHIPAKNRGGAESGQVVSVELTAYPAGQQGLEGKVMQVLGRPGDPDLEALTVIAKYELPYTFPDEVLQEARSFSQKVGEADLAGRTDLRGNLTVTIDGETARDFDDAVSVRREGSSSIRLWVSIADVSHYVKPGSLLDLEAFRRGTSVYFPDRCLPMLPEELSNGICSLNPQVERLTLTAEMLFDMNGGILEKKFYPSVIRSAARLTYTAVRKVLVDKDAEELERLSNLLPDLLIMRELAERLMEKRRRRGSIDFDLPEPEIILDLQGQTEAIVRSERNLAHRIIEEFMLAANEAVSSSLEEENVPSLFRIHEPPDPSKLGDFREFIFNFGYEFHFDGERAAPLELQKLLDSATGKPEERMINQVLLRCMKQARYSAENLGHFGLAATSYTHFTSPIRRYPDLVIHRLLKRMLLGKLKEKESERLAAVLPDIAEQSSKRERTAMEAERELVELKKLQFMLDKVGEEYDGFIGGVNSYGFFVELVDLFVEGMVHVTTLPADFYRFIVKQHTLQGERSKERYRIGDRVRIRVASVSLEKKQIDFVLAGLHEARADVVHTGENEEYRRVPVRGKRPSLKGRRAEQPASGGKPGKSGSGAKRGGKGSSSRRKK